MRWRWVLRVAFVLLALFALWWQASQRLWLSRTIVAKVPSGVSRLIKTDLDGDGEPELLVAHAPSWLQRELLPLWTSSSHDGITDIRLWLIRSPLTKPQAEQLPYVCRLPFPEHLPPLRAVLVEEGEWTARSSRTMWYSLRWGWLTLEGDRPKFVPLISTRARVHCYFARSSNKQTDTLVIAYSNLLSSSPSMHRFVFQAQPDGTWRPLPLSKPLRLFSPFTKGREWLGDFDGDGLLDMVAMERPWSKTPSLTVYWGDGSPPSSLSHSLPLTFTKVEVGDIDGDKRDELIAFHGNSLLHIWRINKSATQMERLASLTLRLPTSQPSLARPVKTPSPPSLSPMPSNSLLPHAFVRSVVEDVWRGDLDGDGRQELLLFWREGGFLGGCGLGMEMTPRPILAVQVVWWDGQKLRSRLFPADNKLPRFSLPITLIALNGQRYALVSHFQQRRLFHPRLLSLRPLRWVWWETESDDWSCLYRLPKGERARDLTAWEKVAQLPGTPMLIGDWDDDGRLELLLRQTRTRRSAWPDVTSHDFLCLARFDGRKVRYARWTQPRPPRSKWVRVVSPVVLKGRSGVALFVVWNAEGSDESFIERIRW